MKLLNTIIEKSAAANGYDKGSDDYEIMEYGFKNFFSFIIKVTLTIFIACKMGMVKEILYLIGLLSIIKPFSKGVHFKPVICAVMCFIYFIGGITIARILPFHRKLTDIVFLICFILNVKYAPSPTINCPFITERKFLIYKHITLICFFVIYILIDFVNNPVLKNINMIAVIIETFTILPLTYKIFHEQRPNDEMIKG